MVRNVAIFDLSVLSKYCADKSIRHDAARFRWSRSQFQGLTKACDSTLKGAYYTAFHCAQKLTMPIFTPRAKLTMQKLSDTGNS